MHKPKTLADFPRFTVSAVREGKTDGALTSFELEGRFDRPFQRSNIEWFWLLSERRFSICPTVESLNSETNEAILSFVSEKLPSLAGETLFYLDPYWQAYNVWMVLDPNWGWEKLTFQGIDAIAEDYEAPSTSIVDGREVKRWTKIEPASRDRGLSRYYPATEQSAPLSSERKLIPLGWDHEHSSLCNKHVDTGDIGYKDPDAHWLCQPCYERYVIPRDLSFVDEH